MAYSFADLDVKIIVNLENSDPAFSTKKLITFGVSNSPMIKGNPANFPILLSNPIEFSLTINLALALTSRKTSLPTLGALPLNVIVDRLLQAPNAPLPISRTASGIVILSRLVQNKNA